MEKQLNQKLGFWLRHPRLLPHRIRSWVRERSRPEAPWLCPGTILFGERHFRGLARGLEFGSGRSTAWLATLVQRLTSVEHDARWFAIVEEKLAARALRNVDHRFIALGHPEYEAERPSYDPLPAYVAVANEFPDSSLNLVLIDGHYRSACIRAVISKIAPAGYLIVDDANFWPSAADNPMPDWPVADRSSNGLKTCLVFQKPTTETPSSRR
jgi:predicted O-methyltransferase YrrM